MEEDANLKNNFVNIRQFLVPHLRSSVKLFKNSSQVVIRMIESPVLAVIFYNYVPPFPAYQVILLLRAADNAIYSVDHFHPNLLIVDVLLICEPIFSQNMKTYVA